MTAHPPAPLAATAPSPLQEVHDERFARRGVRLLLKRDDLLRPAPAAAWAGAHAAGPAHGAGGVPARGTADVSADVSAARTAVVGTDAPAPGAPDAPEDGRGDVAEEVPAELAAQLGGNKLRKLAPTLREALAEGRHTLLTFGGAYSNHLRATAAAGRLLGLRTIGVVRGQELADRPLNPSLARCAAHGMRLHFVTRAAYRRRAEPAYLAELHARFGEFLAIPEGGSSAAAVRGCRELGRELRAAPTPPGPPDVVAVACGTGGTLAGLAAGLGPGQRALGVAVVGGGFLAEEIRALQAGAFGGPRGAWRLEERFHHGGYGRVPPDLARFAADFSARHGVGPLDLPYVAKLLYALVALAEDGAFPRGGTVAAVLTGRASESNPGGVSRN